MKKIFCVFLCFVMLLMAGCATQIDLEPYVDIKFEGYDGSGTAFYEIDYEELITDYEDVFGFDEDDLEKKSGQRFLEDMMDAIDGELSEDEDLKNGDKITFSWDLDVKDLEKEYKVKFVAEDKEVKVKRLDEEDETQASMSEPTMSPDNWGETPKWPEDEPVVNEPGVEEPATEVVVVPTETPVPEVDLGPYTIRKDEYGNTLDFGGMHVIVRDWWASGERTINNAYDEMRWEYVEWLEETYNFTIEEKAIGDWSSNQTDFQYYASEPDDGENYIFTLRTGDMFLSMVESGFMKDLNALNVFDLTEEKFTRNGAHKYMQMGDKIYGMNAGHPEPRGCLYFNKRLVQEAGIDPEQLYDWQLTGEWTWAKLEEVLAQVQRDVDRDGIIDVYGMAQQASDIYKCAVVVNGGSFIGKDDNGKFYNNLENPATIEALNWAVDVRAKYEMPQPADSAWNWYFEEFMNGNAAFMTGQAYMAGQDLRDMIDDIGCLAFPMGPNSDGYKGYYEDNVMVIPANYSDEKARDLAIIYDLYTAPIPGFEDQEDWKINYYMTMDDTRSVDESLAYLVGNGEPLYDTMVSGISLGADILWELGDTYMPAERAEQLREIWDYYIYLANLK